MAAISYYNLIFTTAQNQGKMNAATDFLSHLELDHNEEKYQKNWRRHSNKTD